MGNHQLKSKDRQHNGQKEKDKRTNNDIQNTTQKTKLTRTPLTAEVELRCLEKLAVTAPLVPPVVLL